MGLFFKRNLPNEYKQIKNKMIVTFVITQVFIAFRAVTYFDMMYLTDQKIRHISNILVILSEISLAMCIIWMDYSVNSESEERTSIRYKKDSLIKHNSNKKEE